MINQLRNWSKISYSHLCNLDRVHKEIRARDKDTKICNLHIYMNMSDGKSKILSRGYCINRKKLYTYLPAWACWMNNRQKDIATNARLKTSMNPIHLQCSSVWNKTSLSAAIWSGLKCTTLFAKTYFFK